MESLAKEFQLDVMVHDQEARPNRIRRKKQVEGGHGRDKLTDEEKRLAHDLSHDPRPTACYRARSTTYGRRGASGVAARQNGDLGLHHAAKHTNRRPFVWRFDGVLVSPDVDAEARHEYTDLTVPTAPRGTMSNVGNALVSEAAPRVHLVRGIPELNTSRNVASQKVNGRPVGQTGTASVPDHNLAAVAGAYVSRTRCLIKAYYH